MKPYADANFFTRLYLPLPQSSAADELIESSSEHFALPITWLLRCEIVNALELSVFASRSGGPRVSASQAGAAQAHFREDSTADGLLQLRDLSPGKWWQEFEALSLRHSARKGFRAYDLLHVSAALQLSCDTFWSFDRKARELAKLEGLALNSWPD